MCAWLPVQCIWSISCFSFCFQVFSSYGPKRGQSNPACVQPAMFPLGLRVATIDACALQAKMEVFTRKIVDMMKEHQLFSWQGGPIILAQVRNSLVVAGSLLRRALAESLQ